jgi:uncharacterized membrane protein/N-acetylneuraminic acid mutarotase
MNKIKRFSVPICLALLGIGILLLGAWDMQHVAAAPRPDAWYQVDPIPEPWAGTGTIQCPEDTEHFYLVGGVNADWIDINTVRRYDVQAGMWEDLAPLPIVNRGASLACYQGRIYAAGGLNAGMGLLDTLYIYNIASNSWSTGANLPAANIGMAMGAWDGKLYLAGGWSGIDPWVPLADVHVYNIATDTWTPNGRPDMPVPSNFSAVIQAGPYLYVVGGLSGDYNNNLNTTQCYNMQDDVWEQGPLFNSRRALAGMAITEGYLYAVGGDANGGDDFDATDIVERLDLTLWPGGAWTDISDPLPEPLMTASFCSEGLTGGEIWAVGGLDLFDNPVDFMYYRPSEPCADFYFGDLVKETDSLGNFPGEVVHYVLPVYNAGTETDTFDVSASGVWTIILPVTSLTLDPGESGQVMVDVEIPVGAIPGDFDIATVTVTSQADSAMQDTAELTTFVVEWVGEKDPIPHPLGLSAHVQCVDDPNRLYVIGGADAPGSPSNLAFSYDVLNNSWEQLAYMPGLNWLPTGACVEGKIYVQWWSTNLLIYDIAFNTWSFEAGIPRLTEGAALGAWDGKLYLVGGAIDAPNYQATGEVDVYDIAHHTWTANGGTPMPQATDYAGVVQIGQYLYIVGGMSYIYENVYLVQRYDMSTDSWQTADYPSGFVFPALTATGEYLYAMGGDPPEDEQWTSSDLVERLSLDEWISGGWEDINVPLPKPSIGASSYCTNALTGGEIWHIGGGDATTWTVYTDTLYLSSEPCVTYSVELLAPGGGSGMIGGSVEYELTITNTGTITDYYEVNVETTWPGGLITGSPFDGSGPVEPGESITTTIAVDIPQDVQPGDEGVSEVNVASLRDPSIAATGQITTLALGYGVAVNPESDEKLGAPGETLEYTLVVTNTGNVGGDEFSIALSGNTWTTTVPTSTGWLELGEAVEVLVAVNIPADAPPGADDFAVLTFSSAGDPEVSATSTLTSRTYVKGVVVKPESTEMIGKPGEALTYTLSVTNTGEAGDMFTIVVSGNLWTTEAPTMTIWLEADVSTEVQVVVSIPLDAVAGEWDVALLTFTSWDDPQTYATATLTSTAIWYQTLIPLAMKN